MFGGNAPSPGICPRGGIAVGNVCGILFIELFGDGWPILSVIWANEAQEVGPCEAEFCCTLELGDERCPLGDGCPILSVNWANDEQPVGIFVGGRFGCFGPLAAKILGDPLCKSAVGF